MYSIGINELKALIAGKRREISEQLMVRKTGGADAAYILGYGQGAYAAYTELTETIDQLVREKEEELEKKEAKS